MDVRPVLLPQVDGILKRKPRILSSKDGRRFNDLFYFNIFDVDQLMD